MGRTRTGDKRDRSERSGWNVPDNDLWIAATGTSRKYPLVTSDDHQARISDCRLEAIHLPVAP